MLVALLSETPPRVRHDAGAAPSVSPGAVSNRRAWLSHTGTLSEEGLLVYLRVLQTFLPQLPVSPASTSCQDSASDSEDESEGTDKQMSAPVSPAGPRAGGGWQRGRRHASPGRSGCACVLFLRVEPSPPALSDVFQLCRRSRLAPPPTAPFPGDARRGRSARRTASWTWRRRARCLFLVHSRVLASVSAVITQETPLRSAGVEGKVTVLLLRERTCCVPGTALSSKGRC